MGLELDRLLELSKAATPALWVDFDGSVDQRLIVEMRNSIDALLEEVRAGRELLDAMGDDVGTSLSRLSYERLDAYMAIVERNSK